MAECVCAHARSSLGCGFYTHTARDTARAALRVQPTGLCRARDCERERDKNRGGWGGGAGGREGVCVCVARAGGALMSGLGTRMETERSGRRSPDGRQFPTREKVTRRVGRRPAGGSEREREAAASADDPSPHIPRDGERDSEREIDREREREREAAASADDPSPHIPGDGPWRRGPSAIDRGRRRLGSEGSLVAERARAASGAQDRGSRPRSSSPSPAPRPRHSPPASEAHWGG